jgi:hypothetical protein
VGGKAKPTHGPDDERDQEDEQLEQRNDCGNQETHGEDCALGVLGPAFSIAQAPNAASNAEAFGADRTGSTPIAYRPRRLADIDPPAMREVQSSLESKAHRMPVACGSALILVSGLALGTIQSAVIPKSHTLSAGWVTPKAPPARRGHPSPADEGFGASLFLRQSERSER